MIRKITIKKMDEYLTQKSYDFCEIATHFKITNRRKYFEILTRYTELAKNFVGCVKCMNDDEHNCDCDSCDDSDAMALFIEHEFAPEVVWDIKTMEDLLRIAAIQAGSEILSEARRQWILQLSEIDYHRILGIVDIQESINMALMLYSDLGDRGVDREIWASVMKSDWKSFKPGNC